MGSQESVIGFVVGLLLAGGGAFLYNLVTSSNAKTRAKAILDKAALDADSKVRDADIRIKELELQRRSEFEEKQQAAREKIHQRERALDKRENQLGQQADDLKKQEQFTAASQNKLRLKLEQATQTEQDLAEVLEKKRRLLHDVTGLTTEEATSRLLKLLEDDLKNEVGTRIMEHEKSVRETCDAQAREMLMMATQRLASSQVSESTTTTVDIPSDDLKGRIIGREGRNIRAFEKATGIDVIIDDTPGVVIVSGFDPVRREVARISLDRLITDGRIHPSRIEEVVEETQKEIDALMLRKGNEAAQEVGVNGLKKRVVEMLGRLHFRTSYSQNVLRHSIEVAFLSGMLAEMMGFDPEIAKRAGLLHDIGKAADHDQEGGHPKIGAELLKRSGEDEEIVHAAFGHHDEIFAKYPYTVIVATGDACSASRPGARRESLDRYIKRMEELESIAKEFKGVRQAYAVQAGREVRVIAGAREADDQTAAKICRDIANAYQQRLSYPGEIKVVVIRESRFTELAK